MSSVLISPAPDFAFTAHRLTPALERRVTGSSWHEGCPVPLRRLRYVQVSHHGFDGAAHTGELIVNRDAVRPLRRVFARLYAQDFPIRRMRLVDDYDGSDFDSIEADNTSAFNCRPVDGTDRWSEHAYGRAIDVNPIENPYVYADGTTSHPASEPYLDRTIKRPGMARRRGVLVRAFKRAGWGWGGTWSPARDLQHFSVKGR
jgi:D-alanyl-D-alanine carboxypeptidase-like protein